MIRVKKKSHEIYFARQKGFHLIKRRRSWGGGGGPGNQSLPGKEIQNQAIKIEKK